MSYVQPIVSFLATLTLIGAPLALGLVLLLILERSGSTSRMLHWVRMHHLALLLTVALVATLGSLFFSEIAGWTPCKKCWLQRIFMYPQVVLLLVALWRRDSKIAWYILALSVIGAGIATEHYIEQILATLAPPADALEPCDATGVSCARTYTFRYGYITVPMMALTAFVLNILVSLAVLLPTRTRR